MMTARAASVSGVVEAQIEDIYDTAVYRIRWSKSTTSRSKDLRFTPIGSGPTALRDTFLGQGKQWSDRVKGDVKTLVAAAVAADAAVALDHHKRGSFDGLVRALEQRLAALHR